MPTPVTDPDLLAQLNGGPKPVTDPDLLAQLNGKTAAPLEDIGPPAIGDGGEFSPGVPAVNALADEASKTAFKAMSNAPGSAWNFVKNTVEPILHPIDTATSIGRLAAGTAQKAGLAPGESYEPYADAAGKFFADRYGGLSNTRKTLEDDPVGMAADVSALLGVARLPGRLAQASGTGAKAARVAAPTTEELFDSAEGHYNAMHGFGVEVHPQLPADVATNITTELKTAGYRDYLAPKTFKAVDELRNPDGPTMTTQEIEGVRRALGKAAGDPAERDAARRAISEIDDMMANLHPNDVVVNPHFASRVSDEAKAARGDYAAAKRAEQIESATSRADLQAKSTGSGANIDNATRQQIKNLLNNPKKVRGFSDAEKDQMRQIVQGTFTGNAARLLGKLAPTGIVSLGLSTAVGAGLGHAVGIPVLGHAAKALGDAATRRAAAKASEMVRLRSPLAKQLGATARPPMQLGLPRGTQTAQQFGRLPQMTNPYGDQ